MAGLAVVEPFGFVVVWLPLEIAVSPEILIGPFGIAVLLWFVVSNPGHPRFVASPNVYLFPRFSNSVEVGGEVLARSSIDALPNDDS